MRELFEDVAYTKELVRNQQAAVRAENSGFAAGSGRAAAATDRAKMALGIHLRSMHPDRLVAVIVHLAVEADAK